MVLSRRANRRQLQGILILESILLILSLGRARLILPSLAASGSNHSVVVITEFVAAGQTTLAEEDGEYHDWVELHNRSRRSVNLLM